MEDGENVSRKIISKHIPYHNYLSIIGLDFRYDIWIFLKSALANPSIKLY